MTNIALAGVRQAELNGLIRGHENPSKKSGSWYSIPVPGADHRQALPTLHDIKTGAAKITYKRNEKGHIKGRTVERSARSENYLFRDKVVSRTGELYDDLSFANDPSVSGGTVRLAEAFHLESGLGGLEIASMGWTVLVRTTPSQEGQKLAVLEKRRADNGRLQPRYFLRRNLQSVARRYSTTFKREMAAAERAARKAAAAARSQA